MCQGWAKFGRRQAAAGSGRCRGRAPYGVNEQFVWIACTCEAIFERHGKSKSNILDTCLDVHV